jgi:hypothetical protein
MSNCNSSDIINVPQAFNGSDGTSAYVYIAYATTVTAGSPDTVTGFSNDVPTGASEWVGIITTNTPITIPVATDFDNHWFNFKGAPGLPGVNLQNFGTAVAGGPFTTLNFIAAGLTGVTVTNSGGGTAAVNIVTAALNKTYRSNFLSSIAGSNLISGASYWIVDAGDGEYLNANNYEMPAGYYGLSGAALQSYNHKAGIIVRAATENTIDVSAIYIARTINRSTVTKLFTPGTSYTINENIENFNGIYKLTGATGVYTIDPANDPANWLYLTKDNAFYNTEVHTCLYDVTTNTVVSRADNKGNYLKNIFLNGSNEIIKKCFRWGSSDVIGNRIHFYDDTTQNTNTRIPLFNKALVNYSTIKVLKYNEIDTNLSISNELPTVTNVEQYGSRIINNNLQQSIFNSNKLANAIISNIDDRVPGAMKFQANTIYDSVLNNVNFGNFYNNTITNNTVIGDLAYLEFTGALTVLEDLNINSIKNEYILNNLGSKIWQRIGDATSTINPTGSLITINGGASTTYLDGNIGEVVYFVLGGTAETFQKYHIVTTTPTSNSFNIATTLTLSYTGTLTLNFYHPSVKTSFNEMSNNIISNSTIRGLNKGTRGVSTFKKNTLTNAFFENYPFHTNTINNTFLTFISIPGAEVVSFLNNEIKDTAFINNNISGVFLNNQIQASLIQNNGNNNAVSPNLGFRGYFSNNKLNGTGFKSRTDGTLYGYNFLLNPIVITDTGIDIVGGDAAVFELNVIENYNQIVSCYFAPATITRNCIINGTPNAGTIPGWYNVRVGTISETKDRAIINGVVTEGRAGGLRNFTFKNSEKREIWNYTGDYKGYVQGLIIRDLPLTGSGGFSQLGDSYNAALFHETNNLIRNITYTENAAVPVTLPSPADVTYGQTTYQTTTYTLTITTQSPHLLNYSQGNTVIISISDPGLPMNHVGLTYYAAGKALGNYNANTTAYFHNTFACTINSITNDYTFVCTTGAQDIVYNGYTLHSSNAVTDQITVVGGVITPQNVGAGDSAPGAGLSGTFSDTGISYLNIPYPFNNITNQYNFLRAASNVVTPNYSELITKIALQVNPSPAATPTSTSRSIYVYADYNTNANILYNNSTRALTLPRYFEKMGCTVVFGTHDSTGLSNASGTITGMTWTRTAGSTTINVTTVRPHGFTAAVTSLNVTNSSDLTTIPTASYTVQTTPTPTTFTITGVNTGATSGTLRQLNVKVPFQIDTITNLVEGIPFRFVTTPGCDVQFNLVAVGSATANTIMKDGAATSYTIKAYYTGTNFIYDEIVLMKQNNTIKIISKVIHQ